MTAIQTLYPFPNAVDDLLSGPARGFTREFHNLDEGDLRQAWNRKGHAVHAILDMGHMLKPGAVHIFRSEERGLLYLDHRNITAHDFSIVESRISFTKKMAGLLQAENVDAMGNTLVQLRGEECGIKTILECIAEAKTGAFPPGLEARMQGWVGMEEKGQGISLAADFFDALKPESPHSQLLRTTLTRYCQKYLANTVDVFEKDFKGGPGFVPRAQAPKGYDGAS